jgi:acetyltransferase-like isoleucine patch superfamily enzyme
VKPIISPHIRVRHPATFEVGDDSIVDDFSYFSARVRIGRFCHVASGCCVAGGQGHQFELGDFSSLSSGVKIWCTSDDYVEDVVTIVPAGLEGTVKRNLIAGDVTFGRYTAIGANSVVMPDNRVPDGTTIGALSFVPPRFPFDEWSVYAGIPIRFLRKRNREQVLAEVREIEQAVGQGRS